MQPKIKKVSFFFRWLFQIAFIALPIIHIMSWALSPEPITFLSNMGIIIQAIPESVTIAYQMNFITRLSGFLISAAPIIAIECIFFFLIKLFKLYEQGVIFSLANVNYIRKSGFALLITQILRPICEGFLTLAMSLPNPSGQKLRIVSITFSGTDFALLLTAFLIILVSWIMAEGQKLYEEQRLTV